MARYPDAFLEQLKSKIDIVDLISTYINVQRKGRDYWACCPFHNEKTPSFAIRSDQQFYHCFGCGKSGNIIGFMMEYEQISYSEAVEALAKRAGLEVPEQIFDPQVQAKKALQEKIYAINKETARFYYKNLFIDAGRPAREYFAKRGLDAKIVNTFGLGYSCDFTSLPAYLKQKGYDDKTLIEAGVVSQNQKGELIDFFGGRIIIPIFAGNGKVIGFTGRVLVPKPDFAKYKNTSTTAVFNKRKNLFNINLYKKERQGDVRAMILVEGHMDAISLYQAGIHNVVASMGTSLTLEQCREIKRYADIVYVSFDGDSAGQHATLRGLDMLKEQGLEVKVVCLDNNLDPDDYVHKFGKEGYQKLLDEALPLIDYKLLKVEKSYDLSDSNDRIKYSKAAISVLRDLDSVERGIYAESVAKKSGLKKEVILKRTEESDIKPEPFQNKADDPVELDAIKKAEKFVVASFVNGKGYINVELLPEIRKYLVNPQYIIVFDYYLKKLMEGVHLIARDVFDIIDDDSVTNELSNLDDSMPQNEEPLYYSGCIDTLKRNYIKKEMTRLTMELNAEQDPDKIDIIKKQIKELNNAQHK